MAVSGMADSDSFQDGRRFNALALAWGILLLLLGGVAGAIALFGNPRAGDPIANVSLTNTMVAHRTQPKPAVPVMPRAPAPPAFNPQQPVAVPPPVVPPAIQKPVYADRVLVADPALIEQTLQGPLPRIADDGRTPMQAYAPPVPQDKRIRIAVVVGGLGISAKATAQALAELPPGVTLSFAPYSDDAQRWVAEARRLGHEVLLEVPMEPYDFPDSDPGAETLRANANEDANVNRLVWSLTRFTGYAGVTNLLGGRFLSSAQALGPVMTYLSRRGLLFFDNGSAPRSTAPDIARQISAPFVQSTVTLDGIQTAMEVDARLSELETRARSAGSASGAGFVYPVTVDRVAAWSKSLGDRGFVLVPASALVSKAQ